MHDLFLPLGLVVAVALALLCPEPGFYVREGGAVNYLVMILFLINGFHTHVRQLKLPRVFFVLFGLSMGVSLLAGPFLGRYIGMLFRLEEAAAIGLVVMSAMPPTLSSGIVTACLAGGNHVWAVFLTIGLNLAGLFTIPLMLTHMFHQGGSVALSPRPLLIKLMGLVLLPFLAGFVARYRAGERKAEQVYVHLQHIPSFCVIMTVWVLVAAYHEQVWSLLQSPRKMGLVFGAGFGVHGLHMAAYWLLGQGMRLAHAEKMSVIFVGSQKTLPLAVTVLMMPMIRDHLPVSGASIMVCVVFHFTQIFFDALLATRCKKRRSVL